MEDPDAAGPGQRVGLQVVHLAGGGGAAVPDSDHADIVGATSDKTESAASKPPRTTPHLPRSAPTPSLEDDDVGADDHYRRLAGPGCPAGPHTVIQLAATGALGCVGNAAK